MNTTTISTSIDTSDGGSAQLDVWPDAEGTLRVRVESDPASKGIKAAVVALLAERGLKLATWTATRRGRHYGTAKRAVCWVRIDPSAGDRGTILAAAWSRSELDAAHRREIAADCSWECDEARDVEIPWEYSTLPDGQDVTALERASL